MKIVIFVDIQINFIKCFSFQNYMFIDSQADMIKY